MKEFGIAWDDLMAMPIKRFWFLSNQVERLWAERDLRQAHILAGVGSQKGFEFLTDNLRKELGTVYVWEQQSPGTLVLDPKTGLDTQFDRAGLQALKAKTRKQR